MIMNDAPNLIYVKALSGGDVVFEEKLLTVIKKEYLEEKKTYYDNLKLKKFPLVAENVHKLKHKIGILGLEKSYELAVDYENNLKEGNSTLKDEFENVLQNITSFLSTL